MKKKYILLVECENGKDQMLLKWPYFLLLCLCIGLIVPLVFLYNYAISVMTSTDYIHNIQLLTMQEQNNAFLAQLNKYQKNEHYFCMEEQMAYSLSLPFDESNNCCRIVWGHRFNCNLKPLLEKFELDDANWKRNVIKDMESEKTIDENPVFLVAASDAFYPYLRRLLHNIKAIFGKRRKVIGYDLGGISGNQTMMHELGQVCQLEWRQFNFSLLPSNVHYLRSFSWKILIIAEVLSQYSTLIYADTSIHFRSDGFKPMLEAIKAGSISPYQELSDAGHSIGYATHKGMYSFIPHYWEEVRPQKEVRMPQAGFALVQRSEYSRKMLKWALLCASTLECIDPPGSTIKCPPPFVGKAVCHRQDQSVLGILTSNMETEMSAKNPKFLSHWDKRNPRFAFASSYKIMRVKALDKNVNFIGAVKC